jgi:hypothetical protein
MLLVLFALGAGPTSFLSQRFDAAARLAMAPVLGLCLGTCIFTTLIWLTAARHTYWLLVIVATMSVAIAVWRALASIPSMPQSARLQLLMRKLRLRDAIALVTVCIVVAAPLSITLHERHSVGPIGFNVWDAVGYTAEADGMTQQSIREAERANTVPAGHTPAEALAGTSVGHRLGANFIQHYWEVYARGPQNLDAAPLSANLNELIGLYATDTQSLYLITFLVAGALGAFAAVRYAAPKPSWAALLAGVLFAGPFFMQLILDGSQAAICGLAVILPIAAVGADAVRNERLASLALLALLVAGLAALYPLFVYGVVASAIVVLVILSAAAWWRGKLTRETLLRALLLLTGVAVLAIALDPVGFSRDVRYWKSVLNGVYFFNGLPEYHLPYSVVPGWLLQTREFYSLTELGSTSPHEILIGVILPIIFVAVIVFGVKRNRMAAILALLGLVSVFIGEYTNAAHHCSYCTDRALLPIAPVSIGLMALGVAALVVSPSVLLRASGVAVAVVILVAVGSRTREERSRGANSAYFLDAGDRALVSRLPSHAGPVDLESYGQVLGKAPGELPLVYFLLSEHNHREVSLPTEYDDYEGLAYVGGPRSSNPQLNPTYQYVLTRLAGVQTGRRVIARTGSLALEGRTRTLDATVVSGLGLPFVRRDADGLAWVEGPVHMLVIGGDSKPAWISLRFRAIVPVKVSAQNGVRARLGGGLIRACVRATGAAPIRRATIDLTFPKSPGIVPREAFALPEPLQGVQLVAMQAVSRCTLAS